MKYLLVVFALLLPCATLHAQKAEKCPKRPAAEKRAKRWAGRWFLKAEKSVKNEKYDLAMDRFLCSLYMTSHENTVYNIAQLTKLVEEKEVALEKLEEFVEKNPDHDATGEIKELIGSVERSMGLDDNPEEPEILDDEMAPAPEQEEGEEGAPAANLKLPAVVLLSTAGVGLILSISLQAAAGAAKNDAADATSYSSYLDYEDKMRKRQVGATVSFVITGLCAGTGLLFLMLSKQPAVKDEDDDGPEISLMPTGTGLVLGGSF